MRKLIVGICLLVAGAILMLVGAAGLAGAWEPTPIPTPEWPANVFAFALRDWVPIRACPRETCAILDSLTFGERVDVVGCVDGWAETDRGHVRTDALAHFEHEWDFDQVYACFSRGWDTPSPPVHPEQARSELGIDR